MTVSFTFVDSETPNPDRLNATDLAQLRRIDALMRGGPELDGLVAASPANSTRYRVVLGGTHRYDAWIVNGWQPLVVFAPGGTEVLAWWSDQDSSTDAFPDAHDVYAAYEVALAGQEGS
jgi:hypothetical protein